MIQLSSRLVFASVFVFMATALLLASPLTERATRQTDTESVDADPHAQIRSRIEYKMAIADDLIHETIDLRTATAEFVYINSENELTMNVIRDRYEGNNDFEKMAQNVLDFAKHQIEQQNDKQRMYIQARLNNELEEIMRAGV